MNKRATTEIIRNNRIFDVVVRINGSIANHVPMYHARRTSFAGVFSGRYDEAQRLAKESVRNF